MSIKLMRLIFHTLSISFTQLYINETCTTTHISKCVIITMRSASELPEAINVCARVCQ